MSKRVEMWKTDDGKVWATKVMAAEHERKVELVRYFDKMIYRDMITNGEDILSLLTEHIDKILEYYGIEK